MACKSPEAIARRKAYQREYQRAKYWQRRGEKMVYNKEYYQKNKERFARVRRVLQRLAHLEGCSVCGQKQGSLDWHHRDPSSKCNSISNMVVCRWSRILEELALCDVLCRSCHNNFHNRGAKDAQLES